MLISEKIKKISIDSTVNILFALKQMDKTRRRLLLVFNESKFIGLLSIGDIQRAIIKGIPLDSLIIDILKQDPKIGFSDTTIGEIKNEMLKFRMEFMPIVDQNGNISNIHFWEDLFDVTNNLPVSQFSLPVVVMAGGLEQG